MSFRTILFWCGVALLVFWVVQNPTQAGLLVHNVFHGLGHAFSSAGTAANTAVSGG